MKMNRLTVALTLFNLLILVLGLALSGAHATQITQQTLRAHVIELVDVQGQVRAQFNVEASGEVVFRLRDAKGNIRVKLGASEAGAGFVLLDDQTEPRVHLLAQQNGTSLTLTGKEGAKRVLVP